MNIFYLDRDPMKCAIDHCDKHVVKMILEYAQLLSTAHHEIDGEPSIDCYKPTHKNHPSAVWVRENRSNYQWLYHLLNNLLDEYTDRYDKTHKTESSGIFRNLSKIPYELPGGKFTDPPQCMPDDCKVDGDTIAAYRNYYIREKSYMARWKFTQEPIWYTIGMAAEMKEEVQ
tara:strand:+ start:1809 stop:2324 length:516 start_codon:yes stop_codon:yes gene_type:complete